MKKLFFCLVMVLACFAAPRAAGAADGEIAVKADLNRAVITIGDPVEYTVTVRHEPGIKLLSPIPYPSKDLFKIKKIEEFSDEEAGLRVTGKKFILTIFRLGEYILEPVKIEYLTPEGERGSIETSRLFLTVKSVSGDEPKQDIRDIKTVIPFPKNYTWLVLLVLMTLLAVAALFLARILKRAKEAPVENAPLLSAEDEALFELNRLFDSDLLRRGQVKEYFFRLSEILRIYLEKRYGITAVESTTFEIDRLLKNVSISQELRKKTSEVLEAADLAKFAKWKPEPAEILSLNKRSTEIVEQSRPPKEIGDGI